MTLDVEPDMSLSSAGDTALASGDLRWGVTTAAEARASSVGDWAFRVRDVAVAAIATAVLSPLLVLVALAIRLDTPGPVLFCQRRGGRHGKPFWCLKFRTMTVTEDGPVIRHASPDDKRVTRVGRFLRRTSIDELPQLINVLRGDMSLVGPRPHALAHDEMYGAAIPSYRGRAAVRPGLTGLAQISGHRGNCPTRDTMARRVEMDLEYIARRCFLYDLKILLATPRCVLSCANAY